MSEYRARISTDFPSVGATRKALVRFAQVCGFGGEALNDIECALGEALANAAEHGGRHGTSISVRAVLEDQALVVEVADNGNGFDRWNASGSVRPVSHSPRGYGIFIMRHLMDEIAFTDHGRTIRLVKRLPSPSELTDDSQLA